MHTRVLGRRLEGRRLCGRGLASHSYVILSLLLLGLLVPVACVGDWVHGIEARNQLAGLLPVCRRKDRVVVGFHFVNEDYPLSEAEGRVSEVMARA